MRIVALLTLTTFAAGLLAGCTTSHDRSGKAAFATHHHLNSQSRGRDD